MATQTGLRTSKVSETWNRGTQQKMPSKGDGNILKTQEDSDLWSREWSAMVCAGESDKRRPRSNYWTNTQGVSPVAFIII